MTVNKAYILDIASEFSAIDSGRIDRLVTIATLQVPASKWGDLQDVGIAYLVAHMLKVDALKGSGGVTSEKIGDLAVGYGSTAGSADDLYGSTSYGKEFKRLRATLLAGPLVT